METKLDNNNIIIGFMGSHNGSNMQAIIDSINNKTLEATPACLISNNSNSMIMERGKEAGLACYHISSKHFSEEEVTEEIIRKFNKHNVNLIVLAGYMKKIDQKLISKFENRILNIHPSLLPKFGGAGMFGINVHKAVLASNETVTGSTVHLVNNEYDKGRILAQAEVVIAEDDTAETLREKVLALEHKLYPQTIQKIASGDIILD